MTIPELCREGQGAEQVLEENETMKDTVVHDETNVLGVTS